MKPDGGNFTKTLGGRTLNNPRAGQNLPAIFGYPKGNVTPDSLMSYGPEVLGIGRIVPQSSGPGEPPEGWLGGATSVTEWYLYWAFTKLLGPEGEQWAFQESQMGGRKMVGGAVVDFVVYQGHIQIGVRVQTYRFHHSADTSQQTHDYEQFLALSGDDFIVIDVNEQDYIHDKTGQEAIRIALEIINRHERPNPLASGFVVGTG